jgi:hypothetical protein
MLRSKEPVLDHADARSVESAACCIESRLESFAVAGLDLE